MFPPRDGDVIHHLVFIENQTNKPAKPVLWTSRILSQSPLFYKVAFLRYFVIIMKNVRMYLQAQSRLDQRRGELQGQLCASGHFGVTQVAISCPLVGNTRYIQPATQWASGTLTIQTVGRGAWKARLDYFPGPTEGSEFSLCTGSQTSCNQHSNE